MTSLVREHGKVCISADLAVLGSIPIGEGNLSSVNEVPLHTAFHYHPFIVFM